MKYIEFDSNKINNYSFQEIDRFENNFKKIEYVESRMFYGKRNDDSVFISVVIPTYNRRETLRQAILSVVNQVDVDFEWECIVIDNTPMVNDTTPALEIVKEINHKKICYYNNEINIGSGYNWNRGVELASGEWISFLHDDDLLCSDALKNINRIINSYVCSDKKLGYIQARMEYFYKNFKYENSKRGAFPICFEITRTEALLKGNSSAHTPSCGTTILKEAYMEFGGINYDFGPVADAVLAYRLMKKYLVLKSDVILGGYRWEQNETLKIDTLKKLVEADCLFSHYRINQSILSQLWGFLFQKAQTQWDIRKKANLIMNNDEREKFLNYCNKKYKIKFYHRFIIVFYAILYYIYLSSIILNRFIAVKVKN